jgi:hypothetical protein
MRATHIGLAIGLTLIGSPPALQAQADGPCALLTTAEVQQAFPGGRPGRLDGEMEKYGMLRCEWVHAGGRLLIIADVDEDTTETPRQEAEGLTMTFVDPLRPDAARHVRYEALTGVGDAAIAVVEPADKAKGFTQDGAMLVVRRGKRQIVLMSTDLARRERAEALRVLASLGKAIAGRLR